MVLGAPFDEVVFSYYYRSSEKESEFVQTRKRVFSNQLTSVCVCVCVCACAGVTPAPAPALVFGSS